MEFSLLNSERILQSHLECLATASFCLTWCWVYNTARTRCRNSSENVHLCLRDLFLQCPWAQMQFQLWDAGSNEVKRGPSEGGAGGHLEVAPGAAWGGLVLSRQRGSKCQRALADCLLLDFVLPKQHRFYNICLADYQCLPTLLGFIAFFLIYFPYNAFLTWTREACRFNSRLLFKIISVMLAFERWIGLQLTPCHLALNTGLSSRERAPHS